VRRGGQFCSSFVANLLKYLCAKNYENIMMFDNVIEKIIRVHFFASQCRTPVFCPTTMHVTFRFMCGSDISVLKFISVLVSISFSVNHFYFYIISVLT